MFIHLIVGSAPQDVNWNTSLLDRFDLDDGQFAPLY